MASFRTRNGRTTATVRRLGHAPMSKTFGSPADAKAWATEIERQIDQGGVTDYPTLKSAVVKDLMARYIKDVLEHRKGWRQDVYRMESMAREPWAQGHCADNLPAKLRARRELRLKQVTGQAYNRERALLLGFFDHCIRGYGLPLQQNPVALTLRALEGPVKRKKVWAEGELELALERLEFSATKPPAEAWDYMGWVILLLRATGLRLGTLCSIKTADVELGKRVIHFAGSQVKNSEDWDCPLSPRAVELVGQLMQLRAGEARLLPSSCSSLGRKFREWREREPGLEHLHLHGLRHTWTTEFAGKIKDPKVLLKITGRKSMDTLVNVYYQPAAEELAKHLE